MKYYRWCKTGKQLASKKSSIAGGFLEKLRRELFLFWSFCCAASSVTTSHTTPALDELECFLKEYCEEEEIETDLFEKTSCLHVEISLERFEVSELEEESNTHNKWEEECSITRCLAATNSDWETSENFDSSGDSAENESNLRVLDSDDTKGHTTNTSEHTFTSDELHRTSSYHNKTCYHSCHTWTKPLTKSSVRTTIFLHKKWNIK